MTRLKFLNNVIENSIKEVCDFHRINILNSVDFERKPFITYFVDNARFNGVDSEAPFVKFRTAQSEFSLMFAKDVDSENNVDEIGVYLDLIHNAISKIKSNTFTYKNELTGADVFGADEQRGLWVLPEDQLVHVHP